MKGKNKTGMRDSDVEDKPRAKKRAARVTAVYWSSEEDFKDAARKARAADTSLANWLLRGRGYESRARGAPPGNQNNLAGRPKKTAGQLIGEATRIEYWNYLTSENAPRPKGVTEKRLAKIRPSVLADDDFWFQVVSRFGADRTAAREFYGDESPPSEAAARSRAQFWAMIRERVQRL